jgi:hypothetical protein
VVDTFTDYYGNEVGTFTYSDTAFNTGYHLKVAGYYKTSTFAYKRYFSGPAVGGSKRR